jgi:hypothetical protein
MVDVKDAPGSFTARLHGTLLVISVDALTVCITVPYYVVYILYLPLSWDDLCHVRKRFENTHQKSSSEPGLSPKLAMVEYVSKGSGQNEACCIL